jgi:hypothetical protein
MTTPEQEWQAATLVAPHLGQLREPLRKLFPQNDSDYPGFTFDFVGVRDDSSVLAIEVTGAWDEQYLADADALERYCQRLTPRLVEVGCQPGYYLLMRHHNTPVPLSLKAPADEIALLAKGALLDDVETKYGFTIHFVAGAIATPRARQSLGAGEFMEGDESRARFAEAVRCCTPKLEAAGAQGMETHLLVVHWLFGSNSAWREELREIELGRHPEAIWAVDIGGWPDPQPVERLR